MAFDWSPENLDREFPVRRNLVYWNHAAVAPLPRRVADAISAHVENVRDRGAADWRSWYGAIDGTRGKAARLIGARASEIAFLPSTSWALNVVAQAFPWKSGDNVVGDDMEFPANVYPWMLQKDRGVEYRLARSRDGRITVDDVAAVVDGRTRIVAVSWVAFHNGWVYPIEEIGAFCREKGILFVVDAIQGLGALPLDVAAANVDVLAADSHKWLLGAEACTVFYVSEGARERVPTAFGGWWNARHETSHAGGYLDYRLDFHLGGRRYEPGSLPTAQIRGLGAALDLLEEMSIDEISRRLVEKVTGLARSLSERGWKIATPEPFRSGIVAAIPPGDADVHKVAKELESRGIITSPREGAVRFSPHAYNDDAEVERIHSALESLGMG
jgi:cysteine desulfurase / selenocysteine lyase